MRRFIACALLLALLVLLVGCGSEPGEEPADNTTTAAPEELSIAGADYTVVRPDDKSSAKISAAQRIVEYIGQSTGTAPAISIDWVRTGDDPDAVSEFEILVGDTNRSESASVQCENGWYVGVQGSKLVILACKDKYYSAAVDYLISQLRVGEDGTVKIMKDLKHFEEIADPYAGVELTLRVGSYNIHHGGDVKLDMSVLAADITELGLDVVGIQEVDQLTDRVGGLDTLSALAEATGYQYYEFAHTINFQNGKYGTAILSRYPIVSFENIPLESGTLEKRTVGHAVIDVNGVLLDVFNTHLSYENANIRARQIAQLAPILAECDAYIITGDFNTTVVGEFEAWSDATFVNRNTYPTFTSSSKGIDHIVVAGGWSIAASGMGPEGHSDHCLLWAELKLGH